MSAKGQTTMIFLLLIVIIFVGMGAFLLSVARTVSQSEYLNLYTTNLLLSVMRADTGFTDPKCKTVSDTLACAFLSPSYACGSESCLTLSDSLVNDYMQQFGIIKKGFGYFLAVETEGFVVRDPSGNLRVVEIGDPSLKNAKTEKFTATERIQDILEGRSYILTVKLTIAKKEP